MKRNLILSIIVSSLVFVGCSKDFLDPVRNTSVLTAEDLSNFAEGMQEFGSLQFL